MHRLTWEPGSACRSSCWAWPSSRPTAWPPRRGRWAGTRPIGPPNWWRRRWTNRRAAPAETATAESGPLSPGRPIGARQRSAADTDLKESGGGVSGEYADTDPVAPSYRYRYRYSGSRDTKICGHRERARGEKTNPAKRDFLAGKGRRRGKSAKWSWMP